MKTRLLLAIGFAALTLSSCSTITHTSQTAAVHTQLYNLTVADMNVAAKKDSVTVDWKWNPLSTVSLGAQKESATHTLLDKNEADVLVEPEYIVKRRGLFRGGSVTVTGYPATYSNFRAMTDEDARKVATINGNYSTAVVSPVIATTTGKAVKNRKPVLPFSSKKVKTTYRFVNLIGGGMIDLDDQVDACPEFGIMYGTYGSRWGWYGKVVLNFAECWSYNDYGKSRNVASPSFTIGAIKSFGSGFSAFAGVGLGGYFYGDCDYDYYDYYNHYRECAKFSIPVELGFMKRFGCINVMLGATYATPLSGGSGNLNPFAGIGYSF